MRKDAGLVSDLVLCYGDKLTDEIGNGSEIDENAVCVILCQIRSLASAMIRTRFR